MSINFPLAPRSESLTIRPRASDTWCDTLQTVRNMLVIAMGCMKELKAQAVEKYNAPGMRIAIGEIMSCIASANVYVSGAVNIPRE